MASKAKEVKHAPVFVPEAVEKSTNPWIRRGFRLLGTVAVLFGGGGLLQMFLPLPDVVNQTIDWYQGTVHPGIVSLISQVMGGGFIANWIADAGVTALGGALIGLSRKRR